METRTSELMRLLDLREKQIDESIAFREYAKKNVYIVLTNRADIESMYFDIIQEEKNIGHGMYNVVSNWAHIMETKEGSISNDFHHELMDMIELREVKVKTE